MDGFSRALKREINILGNPGFLTHTRSYYKCAALNDMRRALRTASEVVWVLRTGSAKFFSWTAMFGHGLFFYAGKSEFLGNPVFLTKMRS